VVVVHGTKKFLDRAKGPVGDDGRPTTVLGNWYATVVFWKPQAAIFVNEVTLLPVVVPLAPTATVIGRFPGHVADVFEALSLDQSFIESEIAEMSDCRLAKTRNRSVVGSMKEFAYLGEAFSDGGRSFGPLELSLRLAKVPCGPLYASHVSPDAELRALLAQRDY
jgi:hypothetical protein